MAAALVKFLQQQYVRRDGVEHRLINGVFGIFGHGNVTGFGQALEEHGGRALPYFQPKTEQAMVHTAVAFAKARQRLGTFACTSSIGPGATNMLTGAATATVNRLPVLLLPGDIFANRRPGARAAATGVSRQSGRERQRLLPARLEILGSHQPSRADCSPRCPKPCACSPIRRKPAPSPSRCRRMCRRKRYSYPAHFFEKRVYTIERPVASPDNLRTAVALIRARPPAAHRRGRRRSLQRRDGRAGPVRGRHRYARRRDARPARARCSTRIDACLGAIGVTGTAAANAIALDADLVICIGTRLSDFTTASKSLFQNPRVRFIAINVHAADARKHGALPLVGDARAILRQLTRALAGWTRSQRRIGPAINRARAAMGGHPRHARRPASAAD